MYGMRALTTVGGNFYLWRKLDLEVRRILLIVLCAAAVLILAFIDVVDRRYLVPLLLLAATGIFSVTLRRLFLTLRAG